MDRSVERAVDGLAAGAQEPRLEFVALRGSQRGDVEDHDAAVRAGARGGDLERMFVVMFRAVVGAAFEGPHFQRERVGSHTGWINRVAEGDPKGPLKGV